MTKSHISWPNVPLKKVLTYLDEQVELDDMSEYVTITVRRRHGGLQERERLFGYQIKTKKQFRVIPGSFIISRIQCWHQAYALVPEKIPANMIASTNYDQFAISPDVDRRFFWWLSHLPLFTESIRSSASGVVVEKMVFDRNTWLEKTIPIPSLPEQERIVAQIEYFMERIEKAQKLLQEVSESELPSLREVIFSIAFQGKTMLQDPNDEPAQQLLERIKRKREKCEEALEANSRDPRKYEHNETEPVGINSNKELPKTWTFVRMEELVDSMRNGIYKPARFYGNGTPCLRMYNIQDGKIYWKDVKEMTLTPDEIEAYSLRENDILLNRVNSRELVGKAAVIPKGLGDVIFESKNIRIRVINEIVEPKYVCYFLQTREARNQIELKCKQTAGQATVSQNDIKEWIIPLAPLQEQNRIVTYLDSFEETMEELKKLQTETERKIEELMPSILDRAFKGEL